jgi:hypothetical protein
MTDIRIPAPRGWYICYSPGRRIAVAQRFDSRAAAEGRIAGMGLAEAGTLHALHAVEVGGTGGDDGEAR